MIFFLEVLKYVVCLCNGCDGCCVCFCIVTVHHVAVLNYAFCMTCSLLMLVEDAVGSVVLFILRSRLLLYSAGSGMNRVHVVLSGFSVSLFCFVQAKTLCRYGCMYFLAALMCTYVCRYDGDVICVEHDLNRCSVWWYVCSVNVK